MIFFGFFAAALRTTVAFLAITWSWTLYAIEVTEHHYRGLSNDALDAEFDRIRISQPAANPTGAAIFLLHGGAWRRGDLTIFDEVCAYFAAHGILAASANYRFITHPAASKDGRLSPKSLCLDDAKAALAWLAANSSRFEIDPAKIIVGGTSAGAHLALLLACTPAYAGAGNTEGLPVSALLLFAPACAESDHRDPSAAAVDVETQLTAWAVSHELPPAIFFFGTDDPWRKNEAFITSSGRKIAGVGRGVQVGASYLARSYGSEWWEAPEKGHGFWISTGSWLERCLNQAHAFLRSRGGNRWLATDPAPLSAGAAALVLVGNHPGEQKEL